MNQQSIITTALITIVAAGLLAAGTFYFIGPRMAPELTRPAPPPSPESPSETAQRNLQALSLEYIMETEDEEFIPRDVARNPFIWPEDEELILAELEKLDREKTEDPDKMLDPLEQALAHTLKVIMIGESGKVALIDRKMFFEGDMLGDNRIISIEPLHVVLATPEREHINLSMDEAPRMIAHHEPERTTARETDPQRIPSETSTDAEKMQYLMQEIQMMQQGGGI